MVPDLAKAFQLDEPTAIQLVASLPRTVKRQVSRGEAERYAVVLRELGAKVAVTREEHQPPSLAPGPAPSLPAPVAPGAWAPTTPPPPGPVPAQASFPPGSWSPASVPPGSLPPASLPPPGGPGSENPHAAARAAVHAASQPSLYPGSEVPGPVLDADHPGFWARLPPAFMLPFRGGGLRLVAGVAALPAIGAIVIVLIPTAGFSFINIGLTFSFTSAALGAHAHVFTQFAQAGVRDRGGPPPSVLDRLPSYTEVFYRGLSLIALLALLFGIFAWMAFNGGGGPALLAGAALAYVYWPMALSVQALSGRAVAIFDVPGVLRGVFAAPVEYLVVVILGIAVLAFTGTLIALVTGASVLGGVVSQSVLVASVGLALAQIMGSLAGTMLAAVQGYLMGCLVGSRSERFEFL